jgi:hypothetical protein
MIYLIGEPGVGKTTTMAALTAQFAVLAQLDHPGRVLFGTRRTGTVQAVEIGRRRPGGFSGTDALPMNVIGEAERYVTSGAALAESGGLLLAEGARLGNRRFLTAAVASGWRVTVGHLTGEREAAARRRARGSHQNPGWVTGARTRAARLAADLPDGASLVTVPASYDPAERADAIMRAAARADQRGGARV